MRRMLSILLVVAFLWPGVGSAQGSTGEGLVDHHEVLLSTPDGSTMSRLILSFDQPVSPDALAAEVDAMTAEPSVQTAGLPQGALISCDQLYSFGDGLMIYTLQHSCGGSTTPWGWIMNPAVAATVAGTVAEAGMSWTLNGFAKSMLAPHPAVSPYYHVHGNYPGTVAGDTVTWSDRVTYRHTIGPGGTAEIISEGFWTLGPDSGGCPPGQPCL